MPRRVQHVEVNLAFREEEVPPVLISVLLGPADVLLDPLSEVACFPDQNARLARMFAFRDPSCRL